MRGFPGGPVVKTWPSNARSEGLIPGQGTKILHAEKNGKKKKKVLNLIMKYVLCVCHKLKDIGIYLLSQYHFRVSAQTYQRSLPRAGLAYSLGSNNTQRLF